MRKDIIETSKKIIAIDPKKIDSNPTTYLDSLFSKTLFAPTYNNEAGSLNVLLTSGKINLISSQELKNKLIAWPGDVADMIEDEISHLEIYKGPYSELLDNYVSWNDMVKQYVMRAKRFRQVDLESMPDNPIVSSDYYAILNNKRFVNLLSRRTSYCEVSFYETEDLIKIAKDIITLIDQELKN